MPDTTKELPESVEVIEDEIEQTRMGLADKLEALTQQLTGTVEDVEETVETVVESTRDTISAVKDTFNIPKQVEEHPWLAMGCSVLAGFLGGKALDALASGSNGHTGSPTNGRAEPVSQRSAAAFALPTERRREPPRAEMGGRTHGESPGWLSGLTAQLAPELEKVRGLALGTMFGVIRDMVSPSLPEGLKSQVAGVIDTVTEKMGGEPLPAGSLVRDPTAGSSSPRGATAGTSGFGSPPRGPGQQRRKTMQSGTGQKWEGRWDQLKGRARQAWGDLTDDDFQRAKGDYEQLVGVIKERTGRTREEIERQLNA